MNARRLLIVSMSVLSGVSFGIAVSSFLLSNGYLSGQYKAFVVQSGSMEPAIKTGSVVITKTQKNYKVGDVITFSLDGKGREHITHRIVEVSDSFRTKGDANEEPDLWQVQQDQIIGKSILTIPYLGYFADFVKTPKGFVILVIIPTSIVIYEEMKSILRETKKIIFKLQHK